MTTEDIFSQLVIKQYKELLLYNWLMHSVICGSIDLVRLRDDMHFSPPSQFSDDSALSPPTSGQIGAGSKSNTPTRRLYAGLASRNCAGARPANKLSLSSPLRFIGRLFAGSAFVSFFGRFIPLRALGAESALSDRKENWHGEGWFDWVIIRVVNFLS